jgi:hypothetical protein
MKGLLKKLALLTVVANCTPVFLASPVSADSTADLVLNLRCRGGFNTQVWSNRTSGTLLYRTTSPHGDLSLDGGTVQNTEGVRVYKFQNGDYQYWVWDGTLDSQEAGTLEVYQNNRILMQQPCRKV